MTLVHARYSPSLKVRKRLVGRWAARARRKVVPPPPYRHVGLTRVFSRGNQTVAFGSSSSLNHSSQFVLKRCLWKARIVFLEYIEPDKWDYFPVGRLRPQESPNYSATFRHLSRCLQKDRGLSDSHEHHFYLRHNSWNRLETEHMLHLNIVLARRCVVGWL